jgi:AraC-like DNA-binding protein
LARCCGLSNARLHARLLAETGLTPMALVRQRRLRLARQLLLHSTLSLGEIAVRCGYTSQSAFSAAMLRDTGCSPRQYRQQARDNIRELRDRQQFP